MLSENERLLTEKDLEVHRLVSQVEMLQQGRAQAFGMMPRMAQVTGEEDLMNETKPARASDNNRTTEPEDVKSECLGNGDKEAQIIAPQNLAIDNECCHGDQAEHSRCEESLVFVESGGCGNFERGGEEEAALLLDLSCQSMSEEGEKQKSQRQGSKPAQDLEGGGQRWRDRALEIEDQTRISDALLASSAKVSSLRATHPPIQHASFRKCYYFI